MSKNANSEFLSEINRLLGLEDCLRLSGFSDESLMQWFVQMLHTASQCDGCSWRHLIICVESSRQFAEWTDLLSSNLAESSRYGVLPHWSLWGNDRYVNPQQVINQRMQSFALWASDRPSVVIADPLGVFQMTEAQRPQDLATTISVGQTIDPEDLIAIFSNLGYIEASEVHDLGVYAIRGSILDVFTINESNPIRLEIFDDEIISIRLFDAESQRSLEERTKVEIWPVEEFVTRKEQRKSHGQKIYDYLLDTNVTTQVREQFVEHFFQGRKVGGREQFAPLFRDNSLTTISQIPVESLFVFPKSIAAFQEAAVAKLAEIQASADQDIDNQKITFSPNAHFALEALGEALKGKKSIELQAVHDTKRLTSLRLPTSKSVTPPPKKPEEKFEYWLGESSRVLKAGGSVCFLASNKDQLTRVSDLLKYRNVDFQVDDNIWLTQLRSDCATAKINVGLGFIKSAVELEGRLVLSEMALFGARTKKAKSNAKKLQNYLTSLKQLKIGDKVVHIEHGICQYGGMREMAIAGMSSQFLELKFHGDDKLYLPVDRLSSIQKYSSVSEGGKAVGLDRLGGNQWQKKKKKVSQAVKDLAEDLIKQQAQRELAKGHAYSGIDESFIKFEASFPYEETEDQVRALHDIEDDFRSSRPMDRLICGDVGFGKTEIALRAAYRAVLEGYQVLILVPTTVLCYQHFKTFSQRLSPYGVRVGQLNRFVSVHQQKENVERFSNGRLDVLVGTHRILSKDIKQKNLGLLIIDEEQRFGVAHKEKLKQLRHGADILTLTATPIPRTLHQSMLGLKSISIIATPPTNRMSVKTYVAEFDENLIEEAIRNEVNRGGQVFFVHNRVENIEEYVTLIKKRLPNISVQAAHGQMKERMLETRIVDFLDGKIDVLVCTTIIESGIDMPNVNTLIVNRADRFGLAQLYQLRGRVGRSNRQAFAYFLTPTATSLSDDASKRLDVLSTYQDLGSGFQIASHDLEIRGAGNLLGAEQSGHAGEVGLELYTQLLEKAINEIKGEIVQEKVDVEIKLPVRVMLPATYIRGESERLVVYKDLFSSEDPEVLSQVVTSIEDRYGAAPDLVQNLFKLAKIKIKLERIGVLLICVSAGGIEIQFREVSSETGLAILEIVKNRPEHYKIVSNERLRLNIDQRHPASEADQGEMLDQISSLLEPLYDRLQHLV